MAGARSHTHGEVGVPRGRRGDSVGLNPHSRFGTRQACGERHSGHAGLRLQALDELDKAGVVPRGKCETIGIRLNGRRCVFIHHDSRGEEFICGESRFGQPVPHQLSALERGRRQNGYHERDLRHDQRRPCSPEPHPPSAPTLEQPRLQAPPRGLKGRHDAHDGGAEKAQRQHVQHHARGQPEVYPERNGEELLHLAADIAEGHIGDRKPQHRSRARQDERFDEELPDDPATTRAERASDGNLAMPCRRPRIYETGDVDGYDYEERRHEELDQVNLPEVQLVEEERGVRHDTRPEMLVRPGECCSRPKANRRQLRLGALGRGAWRQPAEHVDRRALSPLVLRWIRSQGHPHSMVDWKAEALRHDADHRVDRRAKASGPPDDGRVRREL